MFRTKDFRVWHDRNHGAPMQCHSCDDMTSSQLRPSPAVAGTTASQRGRRRTGSERAANRHSTHRHASMRSGWSRSTHGSSPPRLLHNPPTGPTPGVSQWAGWVSGDGAGPALGRRDSRATFPHHAHGPRTLSRPSGMFPGFQV